LGAVEVRPLPIPHDCTDGFLAAFWRRPTAYLDPTVQANISAFVALEPSTRRRGLDALRRDLENGSWASANRDLLTAETLDAGYRIVACTLMPTAERPSPGHQHGASASSTRARSGERRVG